MKRRPFFVLIPIALLFVMSAVVMYLWNTILPEIIAVKIITYWQAMGILILSKILFSGFHFGGRHHRPPFMSKHFRERMMNMTEEEKQKLKDEWERRCR